ncbi:Protein of unknown function [Gryllus bimaculatus]|nr:Protein of unknown function [Gryllus bimaculatus]
MNLPHSLSHALQERCANPKFREPFPFTEPDRHVETRAGEEIRTCGGRRFCAFLCHLDHRSVQNLGCEEAFLVRNARQVRLLPVEEVVDSKLKEHERSTKRTLV